MIGQSLGKHSFVDAIAVNDPLIHVMASATTVVPDAKFNRVTGNTTIQTITPPSAYFYGPLWLFNTDASTGTIGTSGNVALGVTLTRYKLFSFVYDPSVGFWYPDATS